MLTMLQGSGQNMTVIAPSGGVTSGQGFFAGQMFCVAITTQPAGSPVEVTTWGVIQFPKDTTASSFNEGDPVYWSSAAGGLATSQPNGLIMIGTAQIVAGDGTSYPGGQVSDATVYVRVNHSSGDGTSYRVIASITAANLIAMNGTPVAVVGAPGAGKAIVVDSVLFEMTTTSTQFTGGGAVSLVYHGGSVAVHAGSVPASTVTTTAGTTNTLLGPAVATNGTVVPANTGVDITNATAVFAAGTGTAKVQIKYRIVTL